MDWCAVDVWCPLTTRFDQLRPSEPTKHGRKSTRRLSKHPAMRPVQTESSGGCGLQL